jgi:hypothetical protein
MNIALGNGPCWALGLGVLPRERMVGGSAEVAAPTGSALAKPRQIVRAGIGGCGSFDGHCRENQFPLHEAGFEVRMAARNGIFR